MAPHLPAHASVVAEVRKLAACARSVTSTLEAGDVRILASPVFSRLVAARKVSGGGVGMLVVEESEAEWVVSTIRQSRRGFVSHKRN